MRDRNCGNCQAWRKGECHLAPPTSVLFGMQQSPQSVFTKQPVAPPMPVFVFVRPATKATEFCMMHVPVPVKEPVKEPVMHDLKRDDDGFLQCRVCGAFGEGFLKATACHGPKKI